MVRVIYRCCNGRYHPPSEGPPPLPPRATRAVPNDGVQNRLLELKRGVNPFLVLPPSSPSLNVVAYEEHRYWCSFGPQVEGKTPVAHHIPPT